MWSPSRLCFRTGVIFSLYFIGSCNYSSRLKCNDNADASQLYIIMGQKRILRFVSKISCPGNVSNMLKCNPKKIEIIHFSSRFLPAEPVPSIKIGDFQLFRVMKSKTLRSHLTAISLLKFSGRK